MKQHLTIAGTAAIVATVISFVLATYGTHGAAGFIATWLGFPGGFASWKLTHNGVSYSLMTAVNWLSYCLLLEMSMALKHRILD